MSVALIRGSLHLVKVHPEHGVDYPVPGGSSASIENAQTWADIVLAGGLQEQHAFLGERADILKSLEAAAQAIN